MNFLKRNWFVIGLLSVFGLAFAVPELGASDSPIRPEWTRRIAIIIIFLVQGLTLPSETIMPAVKRWKVHTGLQLFLFLVTPLMALGVWALGPELPNELYLSIVYIAALPATISTCIVYAQKAHGNVVITLFNVVLSSVLAVGFIPLWMWFSLGGIGVDVDAWAMLRRIALFIIVPLVIGQMLRPMLMLTIERYKKYSGRLNSALVLFIFFISIAGSVHAGVFAGSASQLIIQSLLLALAFLLLLKSTSFLTVKATRMARDIAISFYFATTMRSFAVGTSLASETFADTGLAVGVVLMPLTFFGIIQLTIGGIIAERLAQLKE